MSPCLRATAPPAAGRTLRTTAGPVRAITVRSHPLGRATGCGLMRFTRGHPPGPSRAGGAHERGVGGRGEFEYDAAVGGAGARRRRARRARGGRQAHPERGRAGDRGQAGRHQARARGAAGRGAPPDRGRPRCRQDDAEQGPGQGDRLLGAPDPVHARPPALRRHRRLHLQPGDARLRVPARRGVRQHRGRRRDQPRLPQDAVGDARVHGGAAGHRRRDHVPPRVAVPRDRHPEPDRDGGHLRAARGPARPVHGPGVDGLPGQGGRDRDARPRTRPPARWST